MGPVAVRVLHNLCALEKSAVVANQQDKSLRCRAKLIKFGGLLCLLHLEAHSTPEETKRDSRAVNIPAKLRVPDLELLLKTLSALALPASTTIPDTSGEKGQESDTNDANQAKEGATKPMPTQLVARATAHTIPEYNCMLSRQMLEKCVECAGT
jgi:hypothetical protein